jgi:hypothetical protein
MYVAPALACLLAQPVSSLACGSSGCQPRSRQVAPHVLDGSQGCTVALASLEPLGSSLREHLVALASFLEFGGLLFFHNFLAEALIVLRMVKRKFQPFYCKHLCVVRERYAAFGNSASGDDHGGRAHDASCTKVMVGGSKCWVL